MPDLPTLLLCGLGALAIAGNLSLILRTVVRGRGGSFVPLVGGLCLAWGLARWPEPTVSRWWWVPLVFDPGCLLSVAMLTLGGLVEAVGGAASVAPPPPSQLPVQPRWGVSTLSLCHDFAVPPGELWPWVSDAQGLSAWSAVEVEAVAPGPGGEAVEAGALRTVRIPAGPFRVTAHELLAEVVPEALLVYRVYDGGGLRYHLGRIELSPLEGGGTRLRWTVHLATRVPGMGPLVKALLRPQFEAGFVELEGLLSRSRRQLLGG